jgi:hypothetical protein
VGRQICLWTGKLSEDRRDTSDKFLLDAAAGGLGLEELAALFAQMYERARAERPDEDPGGDFADRGVKLATTFGGAGVIHGDLSAGCAAIVGEVLDALGAPAVSAAARRSSGSVFPVTCRATVRTFGSVYPGD